MRGARRPLCRDTSRTGGPPRIRATRRRPPGWRRSRCRAPRRRRARSRPRPGSGERRRGRLRVTRRFGTWRAASPSGSRWAAKGGSCSPRSSRRMGGARDERNRRHGDPLGRRVAPLARNAPGPPGLGVGSLQPRRRAALRPARDRGGAALGGQPRHLVAARVSRRGARADPSGVGGADPQTRTTGGSAPSSRSARLPAAVSATRRRAEAPRWRARHGDASRRPECRTCHRGWRDAA